MRKGVTTVNFDEIFHFAEQKPYNIDWNTCNDVFFSNMLTYKGYNDIERSEAELNTEHEKGKHRPWRVIADFMKHHKLRKMLVLND